MRDTRGKRNQPVSGQGHSVAARHALDHKWGCEVGRWSRGVYWRDLDLRIGRYRMAQEFLCEYGQMIGRSMLLIGWSTVICAVLVFALPTTWLVYRPEAVEINGDQVTVYRTFPGDAWGLPRPRISYVETVRPLTQSHHGGQSCEDRGGPFRYIRAEEVGRWSIPWAAECLNDPLGYVWSADWMWHIGRVEVGPVSLSKRVLHNPCQYRISANGIIHGPDSPHWSQTSTDRCFATREAAQEAVE